CLSSCTQASRWASTRLPPYSRASPPTQAHASCCVTSGPAASTHTAGTASPPGSAPLLCYISGCDEIAVVGRGVGSARCGLSHHRRAVRVWRAADPDVERLGPALQARG